MSETEPLILEILLEKTNLITYATQKFSHGKNKTQKITVQNVKSVPS